MGVPAAGRRGSSVLGWRALPFLVLSALWVGPPRVPDAAGGGEGPLSASPAAPADPDPDTFTLLAYNVWMRPSLTMPDDAQTARAAVLPELLEGFDALVISELFDESARDRLLRGLARRGYRHVTRKLGADGTLVKSGGVSIVSRWPLLAENQRAFGELCANTHACLGAYCLVGDCNAQKGVVYAAVNKLGRRVHLFATHTQSGDTRLAREVRRAQLRLIRRFIEAQHIPGDEPVLIAGDLNVDRLGDGPEYRRMLQLLRAREPGRLGGPPFSYDPRTNAWARRGDRGARPERLDHVLYSRLHTRPVASQSATWPVRVAGWDLSDHHAVLGQFVFSPGKASHSPRGRLSALGSLPVSD